MHLKSGEHEYSATSNSVSNSVDMEMAFLSCFWENTSRSATIRNQDSRIDRCTLPTVIVGRGWKILKNHKLGVIMNWGGWESPTKKFEYTQNLHRYERIREIWENISESFKIIFQIS